MAGLLSLMASLCPVISAQAQAVQSQAQADLPRAASGQTAAVQNAHEVQPENDWSYLLDKYRSANLQLPPPAPGEHRVVFMGDSITENWGAKNNQDLSEFFPGKPYMNRGASGETSPQMLVRFRQDVVDLKPKAVVILAGSNDIAGNTGPMELADTEANLQSMSDLAVANGIRVVLCSVLPAKAFPWNPGINPSAKIVDLNRWIRQYAQSRGFAYVDYYDAMVDAGGGMKPEFSPDGVHPNEKGYAVMAPLAQAGIDAALGNPGPR
jgi:lysophospholipase L1-like esterase